MYKFTQLFINYNSYSKSNSLAIVSESLQNFYTCTFNDGFLYNYIFYKEIVQ